MKRKNLIIVVGLIILTFCILPFARPHTSDFEKQLSFYNADINISLYYTDSKNKWSNETYPEYIKNIEFEITLDNQLVHGNIKLYGAYEPLHILDVEAIKCFENKDFLTFDVGIIYDNHIQKDDIKFLTLKSYVVFKDGHDIKSYDNFIEDLPKELSKKGFKNYNTHEMQLLLENNANLWEMSRQKLLERYI